MMNLLIAIISETFADVNSNAECAAYQEMAKIIAENSYLVPEKIRTERATKNYYILFAETVGKGDEKKTIDERQEAFRQLMTAKIPIVERLL